MQLKFSQQEPWLLSTAKKIWHKRAYLIFGVLLYTLLTLGFGAYIHDTGIIGRILKPAIKESIGLIPNVVAGMLSKPEQITIDIKHIDFQKLAQKRNVAMTSKILISSSEDFVPALIRFKDNVLKAKLRLKGDLIDHFQGNKWSFRVKIKGNNTLFGMREFSIQHPKTRSYLYEWIHHQVLKREGVISPRYEFINVKLNGKDLGVYALEEHFEKRLLEHNQHREGPILKFNENIRWADRIQLFLLPNQNDITGLRSEFSSNVDVFKLKSILKDSSLYDQFVIGNNLLEAFRRQILPTHQVFDTKKLAKYYAISVLMGALHGVKHWTNFRFYFNPITSLLEPIGYDGYQVKQALPPKPISEVLGANINLEKPANQFLSIAFSDKIFFKEYVRTLERMSYPSYLDNLFLAIAQDLDKRLNIIYSEFPYYHFSKEVFYQNQKYIKKVLNPAKGLHAYFHSTSKNRIEIEVGNIQSMPIEVLNLSYKDSTLFQLKEETILSGKNLLKPVDYRNIHFTFPNGFVWSVTMIKDLKLNYKILGISRMRRETVFRWSHLSDNFIETDFIRQNSNAHTFEFLTKDESTKRIFIKPGVWNLDQNLIIPKGYCVIGEEGTQLNLSNSAKILSYSSLEFIGSEDSPIVIQSTDSTGQGLVVMNAGKSSVLEYVTFNNLSNPSHGGWELTGAVTFYESPVDISHCQFIGNRSEDGLNIIRSEFSINESFFNHTFSDAFDADFAKGTITNSSFMNCGNDAVDVSGSVVEVRDVFIKGVGDKGLSAGENSQMTAIDVEIKDAEIAVTSKDMSELGIDNISIEDSQVGFTVFQKKVEFGPGAITATTVFIENTTIPYLVEEGSLLSIDGERLEASRKNVKGILYGVEYGKSSK